MTRRLRALACGVVACGCADRAPDAAVAPAVLDVTLDVAPPTAWLAEDAPPSSVAAAFLAVYLEPLLVPGAAPASAGSADTARAEAHFDDVVALVDLADTFGHALTLVVSPAWATYLSSDTCRAPEGFRDCAAWARSIEDRGHEIGFLHAGVGDPQWDGYTDVDPDALDEDARDGYLGNLDDAQRPYALLSNAGLAGISTGATPELPSTGWLDAVLVPTEDGWARPCARELDGAQVHELGARSYPGDAPDAVVTDAVDAVGRAPVGLRTDDAEVAHGGRSDDFDALFDALSSDGVALAPVSDVAAAWSAGAGACR